MNIRQYVLFPRQIGKTGAIHAGAALLANDVVFAMAGHLDSSGAGLPTDIQWMPPGQHKIVAMKDEKPIELEVIVDARTADRIQAAFVAMKARADRGEDDQPYFDINHNDEEASAHPTGFFWGGDDPKTGGVRARLQWTAAGEAAVRGRTFRRFSPSFFPPDKEGRISNSPVNMGGLVNRAAFQRIAPIWSKQGQRAGEPAPTPNNQDKPMKTLLAILARAGILSSADLDEATAGAQAQTNIANLQTESSTVKTKLSVTETERDTFKGRATDAEQKLEKFVNAHATSVVESAINAGRIPAKNEELKAKWIQLIKLDPENEKLLPDANPALAGEVITAKAVAGSVTAIATAKEDEFIVNAKAYAARSGIKGDETDVITAYANANPAAYNAYRTRLGLGR